MHHPLDVEAAKHLVTFLTVPEAAAFLRVAVATLSRWRVAGDGPPFRKFGRRVLYAQHDLIDWANRQSRLNTSEKR
jgi:hypothetical protein